MNAGNSIVPRVPVILAVQVRLVAIAAFTTASEPSGMTQHGSDVLVDAVRSNEAGGCDHAMVHRGRSDASCTGYTPRSSSPPPPRVASHRRFCGVSRHDVSEVGLDEAGFADHIVVEQFDQLAVRRKEPRPHRLHQEQTAVTCRVDHPTSLSSVQRERLLAQHVLARLQEHERVVFVARLRSGDVHDVDQRIRSQLLIAAVCVRNVETLGECSRPIDRSRPDRDQMGVIDQRKVVGKPGRHRPRSRDPPPHAHRRVFVTPGSTSTC